MDSGGGAGEEAAFVVIQIQSYVSDVTRERGGGGLWVPLHSLTQLAAV